MLNNLVRYQWRKLFPILQKKIPTLYGKKIFSLLDKAALVFHSLYENNNYDPNYNGERWLLNQNFKDKFFKCNKSHLYNKLEYLRYPRRDKEEGVF